MTDYTPPEEMRAALLERFLARLGELYGKRTDLIDVKDGLTEEAFRIALNHALSTAIAPDLGELVGALEHLEKLHRRPVHAAWICTLCDEPNGHLEDCPFAALSKWRQP